MLMAIGLEVAILPGFAVARRMDLEGDWKRHLMLSPAIGLLICLGLSGISFILEWTLEALTYLIISVNILAMLAIRTEVESEQTLAKIERSPWFWIFTVIACFIALTPLTYSRPMGVDWIGFASLTDAVTKSGGFILSEPSIGEWIYPPAFPTFAAWLGGSPSSSVFILGTMCFFALLLGIAAVGEKIGCGHWTIMAMLLAPALFAKNLDSGYPTVASQLGIIVLLLMYGEKIRWDLVVITAMFVAMIHPTGLIYLSTLIIAQLIILKGKDFTITDSFQLAILCTTILLVLVAVSPAFDGDAVFAEYGWQGGAPMAIYAGLLLPLGIWSAWTLRSDSKAMVFALWFTLNWVLSAIHLFEGLTGVTILSIMSYALYSMSMHAFHIPLAGLVGMRLAKLDGGSSSDGGRAIMIVTLIICGFASSALSELAHHDELHVISDGDEALINSLGNLPEGSIVYAENEHWGHIYSIPEHIGVTAVPTLGILNQKHSIQNIATTAVIHDDISKLQELGITHAIASPKGVMMASHDSKIINSADRIVKFPFEEKRNSTLEGKFERLVTTSERTTLIGHRLNLRTLCGLANNGIAGLLTLGALIALFNPLNLEGKEEMGFIMAPALAAGLCGNPINKLLMENRSHAWWSTKSKILPNSIFHSFILYLLLTFAASVVTNNLDGIAILAGGLLGVITEACIALITQSTLKLSRPNAVMIRLLTPVLILPWALVVDTLTT